MTPPPAERTLRVVLYVLGFFHLAVGLGLMFSTGFQTWIAGLYGASLDGSASTVYLIRTLGSFVVAFGTMALAAARHPARSGLVILGLIELFLLRNLHRHLYADELREGFGVGPTTNTLTTVFVTLCVVLLATLWWRVYRASSPRAHTSGESRRR